MPGGIGGLIALLLLVFCLFDAIGTSSALVQNLPKIVWVFVIVLIPIIGPLAWLLLGRPHGAPLSIGERTKPRSRPRAQTPAEPPAPEISPADYQRLREEAIRRHEEEKEELARKREAEREAQRLQEWEAELRRREQDLSRRETDDEGAGT